MTLQEIKDAVDAGKTVHWGNDSYTVLGYKSGWYEIVHTGGSAVGLTWVDGVTLNGDESEFYTV